MKSATEVQMLFELKGSIVEEMMDEFLIISVDPCIHIEGAFLGDEEFRISSW